MKSIWAVCAMIFLLPAMALGGACLGDSLGARRFPSMVSKPYSNLKVPVHLPCDTMVIAENDTAILHSGAMIHFGPRSSSKNVIIVKGTLITLGNEFEPVYFSGSIEEGSFGYRPSASPWRGIHVASTGRVNMRHTRIFNATSALTSESNQVTFSHVYLQGSLNIMPPWKDPINLDYAGTTIDTLDFSDGGKPRNAANAPGPKTKTPPKKVRSEKAGSPLIWAGLGTGALVAGAGIWIWAQSGGSPSSNTVSYPKDPLLPDNSDPRDP